MSRLRSRGLTLIEMMVALLIGSILVVAVLIVLAGQGTRVGSESARRSLGSNSDLDQAGAVAVLQLDKWLRSAGSGLAQTVQAPYTYSYAYGCKIFASKSSTQLLPASSSLPAPFDSMVPSATAGEFRLLPVLIVPGATSPNATNAVTTGHTSDALVVMSSGNSYAQVPTPFTAAATSTQLTVPNSTAYSGAGANDLVLVADQQPASTTNLANCMVEQIALTTTDGSATALPIGGAYSAGTIDSQQLSSFSSTGVVVDLGSSTSTQPPQFLVIGVGDNDTLYSYDLLNVSTPALQARGENVFEMHALYGVDNDGDGAIDTWVSPSSGSYTVSALTAGTITASNLIKKIKAVRVGLILRTDLPEKSAVSAASSQSVTLFSGLADVNSAYSSLAYTRTFTGAEQNYRYRTVEATIPVRNNSF